MQQPLSQAELFKRFMSWQCRVRKMCVRELGGQPSIGMTAGVYSVDRDEDEEKSRLNFLIVVVMLGIFVSLFASMGLVLLPVPVVFYLMGCLVITVQTLVFCLLSVIYITLAIQHEEEH